MSSFDRYGYPLSTLSERAAEPYRNGIDLMLSAWPGAADALDQAIAADPEFALAHIARARMHFLYADGAATKAAVAVARQCVGRNGTPREKSHVEALALGMEGQAAKSLTCVLEHLEAWPRDALILSLPLGAFGLFAFSGMPDHDQARVDLCERYGRHYGDDWWFLTSLGWSHTENGEVRQGRAITQRAFDKRRENANAVHALAHAMFEDGSLADTEALIDGWLPLYGRRGLLHCHISWHQALVALEHGDAERALAIYADSIRSGVTAAPALNAVTDGASLLWRCSIYGHSVAKTIVDDAAVDAEQAFPRAGVAFADVHVAILAALAGNRSNIEQRVSDLEKRLDAGKLAQGSIVPAICRAVFAFADGSFAHCADILEPAAAEVVRIGGSHAQREIVEDTLLAAWMKTNQSAKARALLDQRLHRRPSPRDTRWLAALA